MKYLLLFLSLANSFLLNNPVSVFKYEYNSKIVKVYEPENLDRKEMKALIFYTGANSLIPADIYSNFIKSLNNYNFSVSVVSNNIDSTNEFLNSIKHDYSEIIPLTHSSGYVNAIQTINNEKHIKKAIFLDPVDNSVLINKNFFFFNNQERLNYLENILILYADKSYKGSIFPKFELPFIPVFALDVKKLEKNQPDLTIEKVNAENFGHSDVLDSLWADLMHGSSISKGNENRDQSTMDEYVDWLAQQIHTFINQKHENLDIQVLTNIVEEYE